MPFGLALYLAVIPNGAAYHACGVLDTKYGMAVIITAGQGGGNTRIYSMTNEMWQDNVSAHPHAVKPVSYTHLTLPTTPYV